MDWYDGDGGASFCSQGLASVSDICMRSISIWVK